MLMERYALTMHVTKFEPTAINLFSSFYSPVTGRRILIERLLGKIKRSDTNESIIGAQALSANYFIKNQEVYNPKSGERVSTFQYGLISFF